MQITTDPCAASGVWVSYECGLDVCRFRFKVFECMLGEPRASVPASAASWRRRPHPNRRPRAKEA